MEIHIAFHHDKFLSVYVDVYNINERSQYVMNYTHM